MSDGPLFQNTDEQEQIYSPQTVPSERARIVADEGADVIGNSAEPPSAAPVANIGSSPSSQAAPPNIGDTAGGGAPGDPETQARYPIGNDDNRDITR